MASVAPIHSPASVGPIREVSSEDVKYTVGPLKDLVEWMASGAELPPTEANREDVRRAQELLQKWEEVNREDVNTIVVAPKKKNPRLNQLTGMRALASLWIAVGHYSPPGSLYPFGTILSRSWVAVSFFIFLSGFVTHYAYYNKSYKQWNEFRQFYFRRIGRVLASYYISYGCVAIVFLVLSSTGTIDPDKDPRNWYMYVLDLLMITTVNPDDSVPAFNHNAWTICSLLFAWLCYPFIQAWLKRNEPPSWVILLAACGMYSFELTISYLSMDRRWPGGMMYWAERFPVVVILQFSVGVCFAHLLRRKHFLAWPHWAQVGDFTMLVALFVLFYVDNPRGALNPCRCLSEWFFIQGMTPFFALYLYATSCNILTKTPQGYFSQLLTHNVMVGLGDFSFQVYLWQGPMASVTCGFLLLLDVEGACLKGPAFPGTTFGFFLLFLYLFSGWFSFKVEAPFIRWLTRITELKSPAAKIPST